MIEGQRITLRAFEEGGHPRVAGVGRGRRNRSVGGRRLPPHRGRRGGMARGTVLPQPYETPLHHRPAGAGAIGDIELDYIVWRSGEAELRIRIGERDCWNRGYGTESIIALLRHAFFEFGSPPHLFAGAGPQPAGYPLLPQVRLSPRRQHRASRKRRTAPAHHPHAGAARRNLSASTGRRLGDGNRRTPPGGLNGVPFHDPIFFLGLFPANPPSPDIYREDSPTPLSNSLANRAEPNRAESARNWGCPTDEAAG